MNHVRSRSAGAIAVAVLAWLTLASSSAQAALVLPFGKDDNQATAQNTTDGSSLFRTAFAIRYDKDGVIEEKNTAAAVASCVDCRTVALAFQVVLVVGNANVVTPQNVAVAVNDRCEACLTYASATQLVVGVDGLVRLTDNGTRRILGVFGTIADLRARLGQLTVGELNTAVQQAKAELISIFTTEIKPVTLPRAFTSSAWPQPAPAPAPAPVDPPAAAPADPPAPAPADPPAEAGPPASSDTGPPATEAPAEGGEAPPAPEATDAASS